MEAKDQKLFQTFFDKVPDPRQPQKWQNWVKNNEYQSAIFVIREDLRNLKNHSELIEKVCHGNGRLEALAKLLSLLRKDDAPCFQNLPQQMLSNSVQFDRRVPKKHPVHQNRKKIKATLMEIFKQMLVSVKMLQYLNKLNVPLIIYMQMLRVFKSGAKLNLVEKGMAFMQAWLRVSPKTFPRLFANLVSAYLHEFGESSLIEAKHDSQFSDLDQRERVSCSSCILRVGLDLVRSNLLLSAQSFILSVLFDRAIQCMLSPANSETLIELIINHYTVEEGRRTISQAIDLGKAFAIFTNVDAQRRDPDEFDEKYSEMLERKLGQVAAICCQLLSNWPTLVYFLQEKETLKNLLASLARETDRMPQAAVYKFAIINNIFGPIISRALNFSKEKAENARNSFAVHSSYLNYSSLLLIIYLLHQNSSLYDILGKADQNGMVPRQLSQLVLRYSSNLFENRIYGQQVVDRIEQDKKREVGERSKTIDWVKAYYNESILPFEFTTTEIRDHLLSLQSAMRDQENELKKGDDRKKGDELKKGDESKKRDKGDARLEELLRGVEQVLGDAKSSHGPGIVEQDLLQRAYRISFECSKYIPWEPRYLNLVKYMSGILGKLAKGNIESCIKFGLQIFEPMIINPPPFLFRQLVSSTLQDFSRYFCTRPQYEKLVRQLLADTKRHPAKSVAALSRLASSPSVNFTIQPSLLLSRMSISINTISNFTVENMGSSAFPFNGMFNSTSIPYTFPDYPKTLTDIPIVKPEKIAQEGKVWNSQESSLIHPSFQKSKQVTKELDSKNYVLTQMLFKADFQESKSLVSLVKDVLKQSHEEVKLQVIQILKRYALEADETSVYSWVTETISGLLDSELQEVANAALQFCEDMISFSREAIVRIDPGSIKSPQLRKRFMYLLLGCKEDLLKESKYQLKQPGKEGDFANNQLEPWLRSDFTALKQYSSLLLRQHAKFNTQQEKSRSACFDIKDKSKIMALPWNIQVDDHYYTASADFRVSSEKVHLSGVFYHLVENKVTVCIYMGNVYALPDCRSPKFSITEQADDIYKDFVGSFVRDGQGEKEGKREREKEGYKDELVLRSIVRSYRSEQNAYYSFNAYKFNLTFLVGVRKTSCHKDAPPAQADVQIFLHKAYMELSLAKHIYRPVGCPYNYINLLSETKAGTDFLREKRFIADLIDLVRQQKSPDATKGALFCIGSLLAGGRLTEPEKNNMLAVLIEKFKNSKNYSLKEASLWVLNIAAKDDKLRERMDQDKCWKLEKTKYGGWLCFPKYQPIIQLKESKELRQSKQLKQSRQLKESKDLRQAREALRVPKYLEFMRPKSGFIAFREKHPELWKNLREPKDSLRESKDSLRQSKDSMRKYIQNSNDKQLFQSLINYIGILGFSPQKILDILNTFEKSYIYENSQNNFDKLYLYAGPSSTFKSDFPSGFHFPALE